MRARSLPVIGLAALAGPAFAITVNLTGFKYPTPSDVTTQGTANYTGDAGQLQGLLGGASFTGYCAELSQSIAPDTDYDYTAAASPAAYFGGSKAADLSRLFFATTGFVVDSATSAAMQAAVWEVIYQSGSAYDLTQGDFKVSAEDPTDLNTVAALNTVNGFLKQIDSSTPSVAIGVLTNPTAQDLVYRLAPVPEPQSWALFAGGFALLVAAVRRRAKR